MVCEDCRKKIRCDKCHTAFDKKYWTKSECGNNMNKQTKVVREACRAEGFHAFDLQAYTCQTCSGIFGSKKYNRVMLKNYKQHKRRNLECLHCIAAAEDRVRQLRKRMQQSKRRCNCYCRIHQAKCPLTPVIFGERHWPGSDGAISAADRQFLDQMIPTPGWWDAAWGR